MPRHLVLTLEAPLVAFGGATIDNYGVTRDFPAASMLVGLFANALGLRREEREAHQRLQNRLVFAVCHVRDFEPIVDFQTAKLEANDRGWTTRGGPEGRAGGANTYVSPHLRYRDFLADAALVVVLRLEPDEEAPTLEKLAGALERPARPLFIGRKPCLPARPLLDPDSERRYVEAPTAGAALESFATRIGGNLRALWPAGEGGSVRPLRTIDLADERNWISGLHGGTRKVCEGLLESVESH